MSTHPAPHDNAWSHVVTLAAGLATRSRTR